MPHPDMTDHFDGRLYHATSHVRADAFMTEGFAGHVSYWGVLAIAEYYAETVEDEGDEAIILSVDLSAFDTDALREDAAGFEEPITTVIGSSESDVHRAWARSGRTWRESLDLIGSVSYHGILPGSSLRVET